MTQSTPAKSTDLLDVVVLCIIVFAGVYILGGLFQKFAGSAGWTLTELYILGLSLLYLKARQIRPASVMRWRGIPSASLPAMLALAISAALLFDAIDRVIDLALPMPEEQLNQLRSSMKLNPPWNAVWIIVGAALVGPLVEESVFRGAIMRALQNKGDITKAITGSSLIFALLHLQPWWIIQLLLLSVLAGYLAWRWNSIIPAVMVHSANNLWSLILLNYDSHPRLESYFWKGMVNPVIAIIMVIVFLASFRHLETQAIDGAK